MEPEFNYEMWLIEDVEEWGDNPRDVYPEDFKRLKESIQKHNQFKPIVVNTGKYWGKRGLIAGGNMRYRAFQELGYKKVVVSLIDFKNEAEMVEYSLIDNDLVGYYVGPKLAPLLIAHREEIKLDKFKLHFGNPTNMERFVRNSQAIKEKEIDEGIGTTNKCPRCGYEW